MPRGVYDRSKMKKKAASTETAHAAPKSPKGKPGRKPGSKNKPKASLPGASLAQGLAVGFSDLHLISEVRNNLVTLNLLADKFGGSVPSITAEITTQVGYLSQLSKKSFAEEPATEATSSTQDEEPAQPNGAKAYAGTVPMPPAPVTVPSMPTH